MSYIRITNASFFDKDYNSTFARQKEYRFFNVGSSMSTLVPIYIEIFRKILGNKVDETFQDFALSKEETEQIKTIFEQHIDETLPLVENYKPYHEKLFWKEKEYELNLSIPSPNNRRISDYYKIVQICEECLAVNKPMYLSIE